MAKLNIDFEPTKSLEDLTKKIDVNSQEVVDQNKPKTPKVVKTKTPKAEPVEIERTSLGVPKADLELIRDLVAVNDRVNVNQHLCNAVKEYLASHGWTTETVARRPADYVMKKGRRKNEE